ncbi:MAG: hypothetical protein A2Z18_01665 [Armatimonadetes bacterium RBG_16_58_9]|nr:MAG: hypothetical protein A2Z18_01665 [Armatimonadetes bacterium RBG_16_58_9]
MKVQTTRFGALEVDEGSTVNMASGPLGFEQLTRFCLIQHRSDTSFRWLQSMEDPSLAFVVVDPTEFFDDYEIEISDAYAEMLRLQSEEDALLFVVLTVGDHGKHITANLAAPIVLNSKNRIGMQVIIEDDRYAVRHELATPGAKRSRATTITNAA